MTETADSAERVTNDARAELAQLRDRIEALIGERAGGGFGAMADEIEAAANCAVREVRQQTARLSGAVREQPLTALGLAALAGYVFARLNRR